MKTAHEVEGINQDYPGSFHSNKSLYKSRESTTSPMSSEIKRSYEHLRLAANANTQPPPIPRSDLVRLQSAADSTITDLPLCMTFDSGISSPASAIFSGHAEEDYRPLLDEDVAVPKDLQRCLDHLKMRVEQRLNDYMASTQPKESSTLSDIRDHLCKVAESSLASSHSGHPKNLSPPVLFANSVLSSSLLEYENTKLSAEVAYLQKKVEILEDIAGTKGINTNALKLTMETVSIGSQTEDHMNQSSTLDETDIGISDYSLTSPETNHLMSTTLCKDTDFHYPSGMSTPGVVPNKHSQRRKLEVPTQLKDFSVATSTSYLSINTWADVDNKKQNGSSVGCWRGLFTCCYRPQ